MAEPARKLMTSDEFLAWAMERPEGEHYELVHGEIVAMAPERSIHALTKFRVARRLAEAIEAARLRCTVYPDGMAIQVDAHTIYEPDVMVRCGPQLPGDTVKVTDPLIVVEVRSPSTAKTDAGAKLADYFRIPSVRHYLVIKTEDRTVVHHIHEDAGRIRTSIIRDGKVRLDPPGIEIGDLFEPQPEG